MAGPEQRVARLSAQVLAPSPTTGRTLAEALRQMATSAQEEANLVRVTIQPGGLTARMTLARPKKLNSLSLPMIQELQQRYAELAKAGVRCVVLGGEGRALCAGGDVAEVREGVLQGTRGPADFFYEEYVLDHEIATLQARHGLVQVALWDGIVMGGGVGLSVHSPIRIATEKTLFAMPETGIALFPDVGMTWRLSRVQGGMAVGCLLGLTGQRLGAADCLAAGLATHFCPSDRLAAVERRILALGAEHAGDVEAISAIIQSEAAGATPDSSKAILGMHAAVIERCFGQGSPTAEEMMSRLEAEASPFAAEVLKNFRMRSPTSVKVTLAAIRRHQGASLKEAFVMEYRLSQWCMRRQPESDFCEGIRAVLVDKDNAPKWIPPRLEEVSQERVDGFFKPLDKDHPRGELQL